MVRVKSKGLMQLIIGFIVVLTSYLMNRKASEPKFTFFLFIGGIFLIYGIFKLILWSILREKPDSIRKPLKPAHITAFQKNQGPTHTHHQTIIACHSCDTKHYSNANYCQMCGTRMNK